MIALDNTRKYVVMIRKTVKETLPFYVVLFCFIVSYFIFLMFTMEDDSLSVFKIAYTLTLGDLDYADMDTLKFLIFMTYTVLITLMLMNLVIAILSDAYELVTSENKFYDGKAKLRRSLTYERLRDLALKPFSVQKEQTYHYLFVSMPLVYEEDANTEQEGMIGKLLNTARKHHQEVIDDNSKRFEENKAAMNEAHSKIDANQVNITEA